MLSLRLSVPAVAVALCAAAAALGFGATAAGGSGAGLLASPPAGGNARLGAIATRLTGAPVRVVCISRAELAARAERGDAWGLAERDRGRISLLTPFCSFLDAISGPRPALPAYHAGAALLVFVHEIEHMRGQVRESAAECAALRDLVGMARRGFGVTNAAWLAAARTAALQEHGRTPPAYRTGCAPSA